MERKIFNSYESRIKLDSDFEQDCYWLLRSACNSREFFTGYVDYSTIIFNQDIFPVCAI